MKPFYDHAGITIYLGDCREILPTLDLSIVDLLLSDPPYGISFTHGSEPNNPFESKFNNVPVVADDRPFDPTPFLELAPKVILWGANHYADKLASSKGWIIWDKRVGMGQNDQSDCEMAWTNFMTTARVHYQMWNGFARRGQERAIPREHPTQKPIELMGYCIRLARGRVILDPFLGSGTALLAAKMLGHQAIGIEIVEEYAEIAARRLDQEVLPLPTTPAASHVQAALMGDGE